MNRRLVKCMILVIVGLISVNGAHSETTWEKAKREAARQYKKLEQATKKTVDDLVAGDEKEQKSEDTSTASSDLNQDKNAVTTAQINLKKLGLYEGTADGIYGGNTRRAISKFEDIEGMARTGNITQNLLTKLETAVSQGQYYGVASDPEIVQDNTKPSQQKTSTASSKSSTQNTRACDESMTNVECLLHKANASNQTGNNEKGQSAGEQIETNPQTPKVTTTHKQDNHKNSSDVSENNKSTTIDVEQIGKQFEINGVRLGMNASQIITAMRNAGYVPKGGETRFEEKSPGQRKPHYVLVQYAVLVEGKPLKNIIWQYRYEIEDVQRSQLYENLIAKYGQPKCNDKKTRCTWIRDFNESGEQLRINFAHPGYVSLDLKVKPKGVSYIR